MVQYSFDGQYHDPCPGKAAAGYIWRQNGYGEGGGECDGDGGGGDEHGRGDGRGGGRSSGRGDGRGGDRGSGSGGGNGRGGDGSDGNGRTGEENGGYRSSGNGRIGYSALANNTPNPGSSVNCISRDRRNFFRYALYRGLADRGALRIR